MATMQEMVLWTMIFVIGVVIGRITMALQYAFMKKEARSKQKRL